MVKSLRPYPRQQLFLGNGTLALCLINSLAVNMRQLSMQIPNFDAVSKISAPFCDDVIMESIEFSEIPVVLPKRGMTGKLCYSAAFYINLCTVHILD